MPSTLPGSLGIHAGGTFFYSRLDLITKMANLFLANMNKHEKAEQPALASSLVLAADFFNSLLELISIMLSPEKAIPYAEVQVALRAQ